MTKIYGQHDAAFRNVSAFIIMKDGERVATAAFKFPKDGAGRLYCYLHVIGLRMARGFAGGYGYDKRSAAFLDAAQKQAAVKPEEWENFEGALFAYEKRKETATAILAAVNERDGEDWNRNLEKAGFVVLQAV